MGEGRFFLPYINRAPVVLRIQEICLRPPRALSMALKQGSSLLKHSGKILTAIQIFESHKVGAVYVNCFTRKAMVGYKFFPVSVICVGK